METFVSPFLTREKETVQYDTKTDTYYIERPYSKTTLVSLLKLKTKNNDAGIPARLFIAMIIDYIERLQDKNGCLDNDLDEAVGHLEDVLVLLDRRKDIVL